MAIKLKTKETTDTTPAAEVNTNTVNTNVVNTLIAGFQEQVVHEFQNERLYLSMALWCAKNDYVQTAKFFSTHALEERKHGMDFINAMIKQRIDVITPEPAAVDTSFEDLGDLLQKALKRELKTTKLITKLHALAIEENSILSHLTAKYIFDLTAVEVLF
jgi:ferritin